MRHPIAITLAILTRVFVRAQNDSPSFEVASVKRSTGSSEPFGVKLVRRRRAAA